MRTVCFKGKGKPVDLMMGNYKAVCIPETQIPLPEIAAQQFERSGGKLKNFGTDPLQGYQHLQALTQLLTILFSMQLQIMTLGL